MNGGKIDFLKNTSDQKTTSLNGQQTKHIQPWYNEIGLVEAEILPFEKFPFS